MMTVSRAARNTARQSARVKMVRRLRLRGAGPRGDMASAEGGGCRSKDVGGMVGASCLDSESALAILSEVVFGLQELGA